jgi:hypothetical protein
VAGEVAVLHHSQPGLAVLNQAHPESEPQRVARTDQIGVALRQQQIPQRIPTQLEAILKSLDQPLTLRLIESRRLEVRFQLLKRLAEVGEALPSFSAPAPRLTP